jgi:hypothetical protein
MKRTWQKFVIHDGLLYRASKLCVLANFIQLMLLQEVHGGGLMEHFGVKNTEDVLAAHVFWPWLRHDVHLRRIFRWTLLLDWLRLRGRGIVFLWLSIISLKWQHFIPCHKPIMLHILLICSSLMLFGCMACLILLSRIVMLNFWDILGELCGISWVLSCYFLLLPTHKRMVKQK